MMKTAPIFYALIFSAYWITKAIAEEEKKPPPQITPAAKFDELFRLRLKHDVAESIAIIKKPMELTKAKSMVEKVLTTVTKDMERLRQEQLLKVSGSSEGLLAGSLSEADIDAYVNLATDLLVFSNAVLFQPDLSHDYLRKDAKKEDTVTALSIVQWAVAYCRETGMFTNHTGVEEIMEQELQLVPRDENYQNPYAHRHKVEQAREEFEERQKELEKKKGTMKKPLKKNTKKNDEL